MNKFQGGRKKKGNKQFTQTGYANMFPVSVKEGKICNKKPDFKKLAKHRTLQETVTDMNDFQQKVNNEFYNG